MLKIKMNIVRTIVFSIIITFILSLKSYSKDVPKSFADLAERLMPSVVEYFNNYNNHYSK